MTRGHGRFSFRFYPTWFLNQNEDSCAQASQMSPVCFSCLHTGADTSEEGAAPALTPAESPPMATAETDQAQTQQWALPSQSRWDHSHVQSSPEKNAPRFKEVFWSVKPEFLLFCGAKTHSHAYQWAVLQKSIFINEEHLNYISCL